MSEYTPTTEEVRHRFAQTCVWLHGAVGYTEFASSFDRWLIAHDGDLHATDDASCSGIEELRADLVTMTAEKEKWRVRCAEETIAWADEASENRQMRSERAS